MSEAIPDLATVLDDVGGVDGEQYVPREDLINYTTDNRHNKGRERNIQIKEIHQRQREMARLASMGISNKEIAATLNITPQNVSDNINSPLLRAHINDLQASKDGDVVAQARRLSQLASQAIDNIEKGINGEAELTDRDRMKLSTDVLDRVGLGKTINISGKVIHGHMTVADIEDLKERHAAEGRRAGAVVDVTPNKNRENDDV